MAMNMAGSSGGGGRRRGRKPVMAEINVTPMVDVMLVLLIIFMVSAPLLTVGVPLDLPKTSAAELLQPKEPVVLSLDREGATFIVYLPVVLGEVEAPREEQPAEPTPHGVETILLVEDEKMVRRYVATVLGKAGYRVLAADDAHEALELAENESIDLLLTDVVMPKIGGPELAARLRLPVLYMSGYSADLMAHSDLLKTGTALIEKPFSADDLKRKVRSVLDDAPAALVA